MVPNEYLASVLTLSLLMDPLVQTQINSNLLIKNTTRVSPPGGPPRGQPHLSTTFPTLLPM
jgi:hypothetical protein